MNLRISALLLFLFFYSCSEKNALIEEVEKKRISEKEIIKPDESPSGSGSGSTASRTPKYYSPFPECQSEGPIGGGSGYQKLVYPEQADIVISSSSAIDFKRKIESAKNGDVVYINDNLTIDLTNQYVKTGSKSIVVPKGVTIASGRGVGGSSGALIKTRDMSPHGKADSRLSSAVFVSNEGNVRFTGIRFQGPKQSISLPAQDKFCIRINNSNGLEVDNCEFYGWPWAAVFIVNSYENLIHNNYMHDNKQESLGYGVQVVNGFAKITANLFIRNRHDIAGYGVADCHYEASCNTTLSGTGHNFDMHPEKGNENSPLAGGFIYIHHNDFRDKGDNRTSDEIKPNIYIRGRAQIQCRIENNRFLHDGPQAAIKQWSRKSNGYGNMLIWNNIYDTDDYLGWYVRHDWSKDNASNYLNLPSSNDKLMSAGNVSYTFGDYNGDKKTDVYKFENGKLYTLPLEITKENKFNGWKAINSTGIPLANLRFGWFNNNNKTDFLYKSYDGLYVSWESTGSWSKLKTTNYPLSSLIFADFTGNGIYDTFVGDSGSWYLSVDSRNGWTKINKSNYKANALKVGRFNSDNKADIFLADGSKFYVSYGGTSSWKQLNSSGYSSKHLSVADFNGDNISDVIVNSSRKVSLKGTGGWLSCKTGQFPISTFPYGNF